jgi:hypothetical protein
VTTPVPPVGPRRGGPPAVPPIRVLTPAEREREARERERRRRERERRRRERDRRGGEPEAPPEGVDIRA